MSRAQQESYPPVEYIIHDPGFLRVSIEDNIVFVYRSLTVCNDSPKYKPVLDLVGKREPVTRDVVYGPEMAGDTDEAEWLLYEL